MDGRAAALEVADYIAKFSGECDLYNDIHSSQIAAIIERHWAAQHKTNQAWGGSGYLEVLPDGEQAARIRAEMDKAQNG